MKYIRTELGYIYEIDERGYFVCEGNMSLRFPLRLDEWQMQESRPYFVDTPDGYTTCIKQSDSIEKLCDKFVFETSIGMEIRTSCVESKAYISRYKKVYPAFIKEAYGAVWTNKGLIYVAKMNEKGEWELL